MDFVFSSLAVLLVAYVELVLPTWLLFSRTQLPRVHLFLAAMGLQVTLAYLKPAALPVGFIPLVILAGALILFRRLPERRTGFFSPLKLPAVWVILGYCFLLFLFRWEAPGHDATKWASLAKAYELHRLIPGDMRPLTATSDLKGASMGVPTILAHLHALSFTSLARVTNFTACLSLLTFIFSIAAALRLWFSERAALSAAALALVLFTNPQQFLTWGGTPTLLGLTGGLSLLGWFQFGGEKPFSWLVAVVYALAIGFAAHAHAIGIYLSCLAVLPLALLFVFRSPNRSALLLNGIKTAALTALLFSPFLLRWGMDATPEQIAETREWQQSMAPYLFKEGFVGWNLFKQISAYLWETSFFLVVAIFTFIVVKNRRAPFLLPAAILVTTILCLVLNSLVWILPLSFLVYPERAATLLVLPFAFSFAWVFESARPKWLAAFLLLMTPLMIHQFQKRLFPLLGNSLVLAEDRALFEKIPNLVSPDACIEITHGGPGMWIAPETGRCHYPRHPIGNNTFDEDRTPPAQGLAWRFYGSSEGSRLVPQPR